MLPSTSTQTQLSTPSSIPNNDSFIDVTSPKKENPQTEPTPRMKKSVRINDSPPEVYNCSPSQYSQNSSLQSSVGSSPLHHNYSTTVNQANRSWNNPNGGAKMDPIAERNSQSELHSLPISEKGQHTFHLRNIKHSLSPREYVGLIFCKIYNTGFLFAHLFLHAFIMAILIYSVSRHPTDDIATKLDGFTVFLFVSTTIQLIVVIAGIFGHKGTELSLQIYAAITGVATVTHTAATIMWLFLFKTVVKSLKEAHSEVTEEGLTPVNLSSTTLVSLFDILSEFYVALAVIQVLDLVLGLGASLVCTRFRIKHVYSILPTEKITIKSLVSGKYPSNEETHSQVEELLNSTKSKTEQVDNGSAVAPPDHAKTVEMQPYA
jgi:hypothetical protein